LNISIIPKLSFHLKNYNTDINFEITDISAFSSTEDIYQYSIKNKYYLGDDSLIHRGTIIVQFDTIATMYWTYADDNGWGFIFRSFNNTIKGIPYSYLTFSFKQNLQLNRYILTHNIEEIEIVQDNLHIKCQSKDFYPPLYKAIYSHYEPLNRLIKEGYLQKNTPLAKNTKLYMLALEKMKKSMEDLGWI
jgi:hypothetical protein